MVHTETLTPPKQAEQKTGAERLTHEKLRRQMAELAILMLFIAKFSSAESDHFFRPTPEAKDSLDSDSKSHTPTIDLLNKVFDVKEETTRSFGATAPIKTMPNPAYGEKMGNTDAMDEFFARLRAAETSRLGGGGSGNFRSGPGGMPVPESFGRPVPQFDDHLQSAPAEPDFRPAPSMAEQPLGPQLPNVAFNDRVRPQSKRPTDADFAAADRANEMYQRALFDTGWRGGEATPDQAKKAGRSMQRQYHPDLPTTSADDAEAIKAFNTNNARPTTAGKEGPGSES